jgi:hypothetical protein
MGAGEWAGARAVAPPPRRIRIVVANLSPDRIGRRARRIVDRRQQAVAHALAAHDAMAGGEIKACGGGGQPTEANDVRGAQS